MIQALRRNLKALSITLWVVIAAFIGTSFFVWGKGSITGGDSNAVATVNGEEIPIERYQRLYRSYLEFYRQVFKDRFTTETAERLGISQQVVDFLVDEVLVLQRAQAEGIQVGDEELRAKIQAIRAFQEDGKFSRDRYAALLNRAKIDPATFEADQRREIVRKKLEATVKVTDAELEDFLKKNALRFQEPERRRLQYVLLSPKTFIKPATDAEVERYYKEHVAEFEKPRRVKVAHILVRVPPVGGSEAEEKAKAKVLEVLKRVRAGEDFAKLAKDVSEDPASAGSGGDLGYVARGELVPAFEQAAFALKRGEVSQEPVRTPFGYHAIK